MASFPRLGRLGPTIVLMHLVATAFMTGLIWFVQIVHYPLMAGWPHDEFAVWEARHRELTGWVVVPPMLFEGLTAAVLLAYVPAGASRRLVVAGGLLLAGIWASTFLLQVPCHELLSRGWDERVHARLVETNWLRTLLWSGRLGLALAVAMPLCSPQPADTLAKP
jgi:hypothetical protein